MVSAVVIEHFIELVSFTLILEPEKLFKFLLCRTKVNFGDFIANHSCLVVLNEVILLLRRQVKLVQQFQALDSCRQPVFILLAWCSSCWSILILINTIVRNSLAHVG